ncbi:unnamed protein product [Cuscuta campestris]|uniref:26S proteasome complex subunit SEM1 n=1 Tax=Cuscuta campestris TaxID=132261 RepID=A0A484K4P4_9ASTE|nr:unnamed protein product [Cuscuta campestris]
MTTAKEKETRIPLFPAVLDNSSFSQSQARAVSLGIDSTMNTEQPKKTNEINDTPKIDLFEDDDEFEEFNLDENEDGMKDEEKVVQQPNQWEDDWDDDDVTDDFSMQLRKELENNNTEKKNQVGVPIS